MAEGFLHEFEGWVVFLVGLLLLGLEILALEKFRWSNIEIESVVVRPTSHASPVEQTKLKLPLTLTMLLCIATFGIITSITAGFSDAATPKREQFVDFPQHIDLWTGLPEEIEPATMKILRATDYYMGNFTKVSHGTPVNLFVAYYDSLNKGAAIHSPRVCMPGSGWEFASFEERNFSDLAPGIAGTYNYVLLQKGEQKILMYYWYQQRKRYTANEFSMKYYLLVDNLFESRKDGALVRLYTPILAAEGNMGEAEANARLHSFAQSLFSKMPSYLPQ
jgi:EpsI family protein